MAILRSSSPFRPVIFHTGPFINSFGFLPFARNVILIFTCSPNAMRKDLLLTFDYELFLGHKSGSVDRCLIEPTNELMRLFDKYRIKHAIFFVDTTHLLRLQEMAKTHNLAQHDLLKIRQQLQKLVRNQHYVFPHLHPHWLDAEYQPEQNEWSLTDLSKYRFHNTPKADRERIFNDSVALLTDWLQSEQHDYRPLGFRAGGWCIQPFKDFKPLFKKHNMLHEFSVWSGFNARTNAQYHEFADAPAKKVYRFSNEVVKEDENGPFYQYSISSVELSTGKQFWDKMLNKMLWKRGIRSMGDGNGVIPQPLEGEKKPAEVKGPKRDRVAVELLNKVTMPVYTKYLQEHDYMHFISHPKMLSSHHLAVFDTFLAQALKAWDINTDFQKIAARLDAQPNVTGNESQATEG